VRLGLAGYMGAGKSRAAKFLARRGWAVVDADREARELMQSDREVLTRLSSEFGERVCDGKVVRFPVLADIVFSSADWMARLNAIVHPVLRIRLLAAMERLTGRNVVLDAALLPLWDKGFELDLLLWVHAGRAVRLERLADRTGLDQAVVGKRMDLQEAMLAEPPCPPWTRVVNDGGVDDLEWSILNVVDSYRRGSPGQGRSP